MAVTVAEAQTRLPDLLARLAPGQTVTLTDAPGGRPVAELVATPPAPPAGPSAAEPAPEPADPDYWERVERMRADMRAAMAANPPVFPGPAEWAAAEQAVHELHESGVDFDGYRLNREYMQRQAEEEYREWLERQSRPAGGEPSWSSSVRPS